MSKLRAPKFRALPPFARIYIPAVLGLAVAITAATSHADAGPPLELELLLIAAALCAAGNLFEVFAPANFSFQPNLAFFLCAALFLPPWAVAALAAVAFLPNWVVKRFPWYMVAFNVGNYALSGLAALGVASLGGPLGSAWAPGLGPIAALAGAALAFVAVNHGLITVVVTLTRRRSVRKSLEDMAKCMPADLALALTGSCLAALWATSEWLPLLAIGPMALIYRSLGMPLLEQKSRIETKTGLYNWGYFLKQTEDALEDARRESSELSVVMIDFDQLRLLNNRHGHFVGDRMIRAVADVVADVALPLDGTAARFGGDELCLLLPGTPLESARQIVEKMRTRIQAIELHLDDAEEPLSVTVSTGIAAYPEHDDTVEGLLGLADAAVYDAKLGGRNRTRLALSTSTRESLGLELNTAPSERREQPTMDRRSAATALNGSAIPQIAPESATGALPPLQAPEEVEEPAEKSSAPISAPTKAIRIYASLLGVVAILLGAFSNHDAVSRSPLLFLALIGSAIALDAMRIDVFERAHLSPAAVPELVLACLFGPLGPLATEGVIAAIRIVRRDPVVKWAFDFGALSLAGAAAAGVFASLPHDADGPLLAATAVAGIAYYVVNSALLAVVMGLAESLAPFLVWRERLAWMTPHYLVFGMLAGVFVISEATLGGSVFAVFGLPVFMLWVAEKQYLDRSRANVGELRKTNDDLTAANQRLQGLLNDNQQLLARMHRSYLSTITSLARTVEAKDPYTSGHTERVAEVAKLLAIELGFEGSRLDAIEVGAIIHDIGKVGVPDAILLKKGPLDEREMSVMHKHPEMSSYIVADLELPAIVKQMVRSHHEQFAGGGYPDGLAGEEIPLAARILSVADAFDAMTSDRPYRKALPLEVARAEILSKAGTQFCPRVAQTLADALDRGTGPWATLVTEPAPQPEAPASSEPVTPRASRVAEVA